MALTTSLVDHAVLVVEPSQMQAHLLQRMLSHQGVKRIEIVDSLAAARQALQTDVPGRVVISSLYLPDGQGTDLVATMRADVALKTMPFIQLSPARHGRRCWKLSASPTVMSESTHEVMLQSVNLKCKWSGLGKDITKVPEECWTVVKAMAGTVPEKEIMALKHNLLEVGITVAQAYCEFDERASSLNKIEVYVAIFLRKLQAIFGGAPALSGDSSFNISPAERSAIKLLADTMGISVKI